MLNKIAFISLMVSSFDRLANIDPSERAFYSSMCASWFDGIKANADEILNELTKVVVEADLYDPDNKTWFHESASGSVEYQNYLAQLDADYELAMQHMETQK